jgi:hypothetical protein
MLTTMGSTASRATHSRANSRLSFAERKYESASERTRLIDALSELCDLLEEYAPSWYTEEHHLMAESALYPRKKE